VLQTVLFITHLPEKPTTKYVVAADICLKCRSPSVYFWTFSQITFLFEGVVQSMVFLLH